MSCKYLNRFLDIFEKDLKAAKSDQRIFNEGRIGGKRGLGFIPRINNKRDLPEELRESSPQSSPTASPVISQAASPPSSPGPSSSAPDPAPSPSNIDNSDRDIDSLHDPLEDLPRMPDTSSEDDESDCNENEESNPAEPEIENIANLENEEIPNQPFNLHRRFNIENEQSNRRGPGRAVRAKTHFMHGRFIRLPCQPGESDNCAICNHYAPYNEEKSEILSYELEKRLFRNGILESRGDGLGLTYDRQGGLNQWQIVCKNCLSYSGGEQDVIDSVFRVQFHIEHGNITSNSDVRSIFSDAPELGLEVIKEIRDNWISLNRAYSLDIRYFQQKLTHKFYFTADECRIFLGLETDEFNQIYKKYLRPFAGRYTVFDAKEIFGCLMIMLRSGQPLSWVHRMIVKYTDQNININSLSKSIRKTLYFLGK